METKEKQPRTIPTNPEEQAEFLRELLREIGDRDLFPEKTARAKKFFEGLETSQKKF